MISGWRSRRSQEAAARAYAQRLGKPLREVYPNGVQASNHRGWRYPRGAVDVSEAGQLAHLLEHHGPRRPDRVLRWGGPVIGDWPHFSATGR